MEVAFRLRVSFVSVVIRLRTAVEVRTSNDEVEEFSEVEEEESLARFEEEDEEAAKLGLTGRFAPPLLFNFEGGVVELWSFVFIKLLGKCERRTSNDEATRGGALTVE